MHVTPETSVQGTRDLAHPAGIGAPATSYAPGRLHGMGRLAFGFTVCLSLTLWVTVTGAQEPAAPPVPVPVPTWSCAEMERFLQTASIGRQRDIPVGITVPSRAMLDDGTRQHEAAIQTADISIPIFETPRGKELGFRDSWRFNVAGYELAKIVELNMVPPYVERKVSGHPASLSWWVSDAMMERDRYRKKIRPPDVQSWNAQMNAVRVFRELIYDTDFNMTNILITKDWRIWMIDFTRAFRDWKTLHDSKELIKADRRLLANLRGLTEEVLEQKVGKWLFKSQIDAILARRDLIVRFFDNAVATRGEAAVLYDLPRTTEACGAGLQ